MAMLEERADKRTTLLFATEDLTAMHRALRYAKLCWHLPSLFDIHSRLRGLELTRTRCFTSARVLRRIRARRVHLQGCRCCLKFTAGLSESRCEVMLAPAAPV